MNFLFILHFLFYSESESHFIKKSYFLKGFNGTDCSSKVGNNQNEKIIIDNQNYTCSPNKMNKIFLKCYHGILNKQNNFLKLVNKIF